MNELSDRPEYIFSTIADCFVGDRSQLSLLSSTSRKHYFNDQVFKTCFYDAFFDNVMDPSSSRGLSPTIGFARMAKWARTIERYCCLGVTYFPLLFIYSITSWAVWVETTIGFLSQGSWIGMLRLYKL